MTGSSERSPAEKISAEFAARLQQLDADATVSVLVVVGGPVGSRAGSGRQSRTERRAAIEALRKRIEAALKDIEIVVEAHGGRVSFRTSGILGAVGLETTVAGVWAVAESKWVRAIIDNQRV